MTIIPSVKPSRAVTIGVDLSKRYLYLACLKNEKVKATASLDIITDPLKAFQTIIDLLSSYSFDTDAKEVYIEQPWVNNSNPRPMSSLDLGRAAAFIELASLKVGLEPVFVSPTAWRKVVYGNGRPQDVKELARKTVLEKFGYETKWKKDHNICEAILLAFYGQLIGNI